MSSGSPTVILEAGLGENALSWYLVQEEVAGLSTHSQHWVAEESDHMIPYNQPKLIVKAIQQLIAAANE